MISVSMIDDDQMLLDGLAAWLGSAGDLRLVAAAQSVDELNTVERERADVVVLDLLLADHSDPVRNVASLVAERRRVLVVSVMPESRYAIEVMRAGALGYLTKDNNLDSLATAVSIVAEGQTAYSPELAFAWSTDRRDGRPRLSPQERAVLVAYASGMTLTAAARQAGVQPATAKKYLDSVKRKYCASGRATYTKLDLANRVREDSLERYL